MNEVSVSMVVEVSEAIPIEVSPTIIYHLSVII
jgi:hypothetical protein